MFIKLYAQIKKNVKENWMSLLIFFVTFLILIVPLPYYIDTPGGAMDISQKIVLEDSYKSKGSLNFAYVTELKATTFTYLLSFFNKDWKVLKKSDVVYEGENVKDMEFRDRHLLEESYDSAVMVAYQKLHKKVEVKKEHLYITYLDSLSHTDLKVQDELLEMDGVILTSKAELLSTIRSLEAGTVVNFKVKNGGKEYNRKATIVREDNVSMVGAMITTDKELTTNPHIEIKAKASESGPSGGLMLSLAIYNALTKEDITGGRKIVGTGTIDENGNVGAIGGVEFKLKGAVKEKADLFLVPSGDNYKEAMKLKEKNHYNITIKSISAFDETLAYLKETME